MALTILEWIVVRYVKRWWHSRMPEPQQSSAVDRVLYHELTDQGIPWKAGESWQRNGRGYVVALERQGLEHLLDERNVDELRAVYCLGYTVREQQAETKIKALKKQLAASQAEVKAYKKKSYDLAGELYDKNVKISDLLEEVERTRWMCSEALKAKQTAYEPEPLPRALTEEGEPEATEEPIEETQPQPEYGEMEGDARNAAMAEMKDNGMTYPEIAALFGVSVGGCKAIISRYKKQQAEESKLIPFELAKASGEN